MFKFTKPVALVSRRTQQKQTEVKLCCRRIPGIKSSTERFRLSGFPRVVSAELHFQLTNATLAPQSADSSSKQKTDAIARLEEKINQMTGTVKQLESR